MVATELLPLPRGRAPTEKKSNGMNADLTKMRERMRWWKRTRDISKAGSSSLHSFWHNEAVKERNDVDSVMMVDSIVLTDGDGRVRGT